MSTRDDLNKYFLDAATGRSGRRVLALSIGEMQHFSRKEPEKPTPQKPAHLAALSPDDLEFLENDPDARKEFDRIFEAELPEARKVVDRQKYIEDARARCDRLDRARALARAAVKNAATTGADE